MTEEMTLTIAVQLDKSLRKSSDDRRCSECRFFNRHNETCDNEGRIKKYGDSSVFAIETEKELVCKKYKKIPLNQRRIEYILEERRKVFEKNWFRLKPGHISDTNLFLVFLLLVVMSIGITNLVFYLAGVLARY